MASLYLSVMSFVASCILLSLTITCGSTYAISTSDYPANVTLPVYCSSQYQFYCWKTDDCMVANVRCDKVSQCHGGEDELDCPPECTAETAQEQDQFFCHSTKECIPRVWRCDGAADCNSTMGLESEDEKDCSPETVTCPPDDHQCTGGQCIPKAWTCDGQDDCNDSSDESSDLCNDQCAETQFTCPAFRDTASTCIAKSWKCDGEPDCPGEEDEAGCADVGCPHGTFNCTGENKCLTDAWKCDGDFDCSSHDDEQHCDNDPPQSTSLCTNAEFKCGSGQPECVMAVWQCDGDEDCADGSDEANCQQDKISCTDSEFLCAHDNYCIPAFLLCSGTEECTDGEDEKHGSCAPDPEEKKHCELSKGEFACDTHEYMSKCVSFSQVCDGHTDCIGGRDESDEFCKGDNILDQCSSCGTEPEVTCENVVVPYNLTNPPQTINRTLGHICGCKPGYEYNAGAKICHNIDECKDTKNPVCDQLCFDNVGSYKCSCQAGYELESDMRSCKVSGNVHPKLLFTNRHAIRSLHIHHGAQAEYMPLLDSKAAVALDFDYQTQQVFYSDMEEKKLYKFKLPSADQESDVEGVDLNIPGIQTPDGLAYDWIYKHLYWTDTAANTINMACVDDDVSTRRSMVLYKNENENCDADSDDGSMKVCIDEPRALVVHPHKGWVFWSDWGAKAHIALGHLDGSGMEMIAWNSDPSKMYLMWPNGLTLDTSSSSEMLYWIDAKLHSVFSCTVDRCHDDITPLAYNHREIGHPYSITVFENHLYWSDWNKQQITKANKFTGGNITSILSNIDQPMDLKVFHPMSQRNGTNHCKNADDSAICDQLCFPKPWTRNSAGDSMRVPMDEEQFSCKCTDNFVLAKDGRSCVSTATTNIPRIVKASGNQQHTAGDSGPDANGGMNVGIVAAIAAAAVLLIGVIIAVAAVVGVKRHRQQKNKNMNFDNPIYKRTTEDKLELPRHEYQPSQTEPSAMVPLTSSEGQSTSDNLDV